MDTIAHWSQADLRRFIVNLLLSDPGALPKVAKTPTTSLLALLGAQLAAATATLTLALAAADIAGAALTLPTPGTYLVLGVFDMFHQLNGGGDAIGYMLVNGVVQSGTAVLHNTGSANGDRASVCQVWLPTINSENSVAKLQAAKTINVGTTTAGAGHTQIVALRVL